MIETFKMMMDVVSNRKLEGELDTKNYVIVHPSLYRKLKEVIAYHKRSSRKRMVRAQLRSLRKIVRRSP